MSQLKSTLIGIPAILPIRNDLPNYQPL